MSNIFDFYKQTDNQEDMGSDIEPIETDSILNRMDQKEKDIQRYKDLLVKSQGQETSPLDEAINANKYNQEQMLALPQTQPKVETPQTAEANPTQMLTKDAEDQAARVEEFNKFKAAQLKLGNANKRSDEIDDKIKDLNGDGIIDEKDVKIKESLDKKTKPIKVTKVTEPSDVNKDGSITSDDAKLAAARGDRDLWNNITNIMKGVKQASAGYAGAGLVDIKPDNTVLDSIAKQGQLGLKDTMTDIELANKARKAKEAQAVAELNKRYKEAQIKKLEESKKDKGLTEDQKLAREKFEFDKKKFENKDKIQTKKENRKTRTDIDVGLNNLDAQLKLLTNVRDKFKKYSKDSWGGGTGLIANWGGLKEKLDEDTQKLGSAFKQLSLDNMVKMFAGMSKAVDSREERAAFEATQASMNNDDEVNEEILNRAIEATKSLIKKSNLAKKNFDKFGTFKTEKYNKEADRLKLNTILNSLDEGQEWEQDGVTYKRMGGRILSKGNNQTEDPRIEAFMKSNNIADKSEAIKILKEHGKI